MSSLNFEASMGELETLVKRLETGDLALEEALQVFEQGIQLTRECQQQLAVAEQKVSLLSGEGEQATLVDFTTQDPAGE
ncbi:MAG: exodeoxyribonuclease VII small subunit [Cellvibrionaceae bacterium]|nr:exodeoxyribonuclease VII small subunit [Cellvibrionaceae bacterium]